jgi:hypothetical protein
MKSRSHSLGLMALMLGFASTIFAADPDQMLEQDAKQLEGKWAIYGRGMEWIINLDPNESVQIAISWKERGGTWAATGFTWSAKENEQGRYIELEEGTAKASDLPRELHYELKDGKLVLKVPDGPLKGNHTFERDQGRPQTGSWWMSIGIGAAIGLIVVLLVFRSPKPANPSGQSDAGDLPPSPSTT